MGSVKDLEIIKEPTEDEEGVGVFEFSDRYSVFDYGEMPDKIEGKGEALCLMGAYNFRKLEEQGMKTHLIELEEKNRMKVKVVNVITKGEPEEFKNMMVPLEVIYRNYLGEGSSVFRRLDKGKIEPSDLGLDDYPEVNTKLDPPIIDFSTKYEKFDRYFKNIDEVKDHTGFDDEKIDLIKEKAIKVNDFINKRAEELGWIHLDGKMEVALDKNGELMLADVLGTLDEDRFEYDGFKLSKQMLRNYYRGGEWHEKMEEAKEKDLPKEEWPKPPELPKRLVDFVSNMYKAAANSWTGKKHFDVKELEQLIEEDYEELKEDGLVD
ncbi:MAG: phosphoribosylaminoimidazolesuccinocarboxamide synthase [Candidatus Thermoplasmatota archaeon]